jgi:hypothetical protein
MADTVQVMESGEQTTLVTLMVAGPLVEAGVVELTVTAQSAVTSTGV